MRAIDKFSFTMGVVGLLVTEAVLLKYPQYFWAYYATVMPTLLGLRVVLYTRQKLQYFMYDFCYFVQITCFVNLFIFPSERLFLANFAFSHGPLLWAVVAWRNSLVFHSLDKVTSVYIHTLPPLMTWAWRWHGLCRLPSEALKRATRSGLDVFTEQIDAVFARSGGNFFATFAAAPNAAKDAARVAASSAAASLAPELGAASAREQGVRGLATRAARWACAHLPWACGSPSGDAAASALGSTCAPGGPHGALGWDDIWRGDHNEVCSYTAGNMPVLYLIYPMLGYLLWQALYLIKTEVLDSSKLQADPGLSTSLRWVASDSRMAMHRVGLKLSRKLRIMRADENFDPHSIKTKLIFCWWQLVYTLCTLLPVLLFYRSYWAHTAFMLWVFGVCIHNGASFYVEVYSHSYQKLYGEAPAGGQDPDQRPEEAQAEEAGAAPA